MKTQNKKLSLFLILSLILLLFAPLLAQKQFTQEIIQRAMRDEMVRNINRLELENLQRPFFIAYTIRDAKVMEITATLGAIVNSNENHYRNHYVRLMVGDYNVNDENFFDFSGGSHRRTLLRGANRLPLEDDYSGIRRALWIATDNLYKSATEQYERKKAALEQQTLSEEDKALPDFSKTAVVKFTSPPRKFAVERAKWEKTAKEISGIFRDYPDIYSSQVHIFFYKSDVYFTNSEGTETIQPLTLAAVQINASTQAVDGTPLSDHLLSYSNIPQDLPSLKSIKKKLNNMAKDLLALRTAPVLEDSYTGTVMLVDQAVAEFFAQRFFTGSSGLLSSRKPIVSDARAASFLDRSKGDPLEDKIGRRIIARDLTIKALPGLDSFAGKKLIGNYFVDEEGVKPPSEIILVENGTLKTLLNNRIPTKKIAKSNGHQRPIIGKGSTASNNLGPSIISVTTSNGMSEKEIKQELLQLAQDEGLDYAIVVRKLKSSVTGPIQRFDPMAYLARSRRGQQGPTLSNPILVYRVYVKDGREELVRSVKLGSLALSTLRRITGVGKKRTVYNTLVPSASGPAGLLSFSLPSSNQGIPASFIVPQSLIIEELEVENEKSDFTPKLPVVPSPLSKK